MSGTTSSSCSSSRLSASAPPFHFKSPFLLEHDGYYVNCPHDPLQTLGTRSTAMLMLPTHNASVATAVASMSYNNFLKQEKIDSHGDDSVIDNVNYYGRSLETVDSCADATINMEPRVLLNAKGRVVCYKKFEIVKDKEEKNGEYMINGATDPLLTTKNELRITSPDVPDLISHCTESDVPVHNSSELLDQNDSDVDSPCWKGTAARQSTFGVIRPVGLQFPKIETEARKTLNPLAPHFFPGSAMPLLDYHENECNQNDYLPLLGTPSSVVALSSEEHKLKFSVKAGTCPTEVSNVIETQGSNSIHGGGKQYALPNKANGCSVINSSLGDQPFLMEDHPTSNGQGLMVPVVAGSANGIVDSIDNGSSSLTFGVTGNFFTSSFSRDGVSSDVDETLLGASKSAPPKLDVQLVINTMHDLSELLKWTYSNDLDSISEHDHDTIQHIINNLYVCMTNEVGQRVSMPESGHPCTSYSPRKLSGRHKVTMTKAMAVSHDWEMQKVWFTSPINNPSIKKGNGYAEIIEKALKENHQNWEEMCTPSLLYEYSRIEAEAAPK